MKVNIPVEVNREIYNLDYKSHVYEIKTMTLSKSSTNTHLKLFIRF